ncbi:thioredoxin reductase 1, cytoplasmic isoform X1 [Folsomia candida]|nr:thioredoxin reductase 1, cytoplasmic isoform X1 [Folsomia candida]
MPFLWKQLFSSSSIITRSIHQNLSRRSCYLQTFPQSRHFFLPKVPPRTQHQYNYFPQSFQLSGGGPIFPLYHQKHNFHTGELLNFAAMPPISQNLAVEKMEEFIKANEVMVFSKSYCPFCKKVKALFTDLGINYHAYELDLIDPDEAALLQAALKEKSGMSTVPNVFIKGNHIGGCDDTFKKHQQVGLLNVLKGSNDMDSTAGESSSYDYDLIVIGGGSGGLAASKEAAKLGKKVAVCDFVKPTPVGTTWGLGGTCVNVGCIPKKLMHQSALLGTALDDSRAFGWNIPEDGKAHDWPAMVEAIQNYIASLNWGYRVALKDAKVTYLNEFAEFVNDRTINTTNKKGKTQQVTAQNFIVAVGGRPRYPDIPGALEFGITSDDLFSLPHNPGKTLCIGASYIALECAGFLAGVGIESTVMVRSILLRGFDQQISGMIGEHMSEHGVKFLNGWVPTSIVKLEEGTPPRLLVTAKESDGQGTMELEVNTVVFAIGRDPCTKDLHLDAAGVKLSSKSGKIYTNDSDQSNVNHIYAIGDVAESRPELTPVAIQSGVLLARRLFGGSQVLTDYINVPTTVFTPLEYGCIGISEEDAINKYGGDDIEVYHTNFQPLECTLPKRDENKCYTKLVCVKSENERVVGFHYLGPHAGEVTQGFGLGIKLGATKNDFDSLIGIHPTTAETFTTMGITKSSGLNAQKTGC